MKKRLIICNVFIIYDFFEELVLKKFLVEGVIF